MQGNALGMNAFAKPARIDPLGNHGSSLYSAHLTSTMKHTSNRNVKHDTPSLLSRFLVIQTVLNSVLSFLVPLGFLNIVWPKSTIFHQGDPQILSFIISSPWLTSILALTFLPVGMLEAVEKDWCHVFPQHIRYPIILCVKPAIARHIIFGTILAVVYIPVTILIFNAVAPLQTFYASLFCATYICVLALQLVPSAIIAFLIPCNFSNVAQYTSSAPNIATKHIATAKKCIFM